MSEHHKETERCMSQVFDDLAALVNLPKEQYGDPEALMDAIEAEHDHTAKLEAALRDARRFIENGLEFGFIKDAKRPESREWECELQLKRIDDALKPTSIERISTTTCQGCENGKPPHSLDCAFQHFLDYTGYSQLSDDEIVRLKVAYEHGSEKPTDTETAGK